MTRIRRAGPRRSPFPGRGVGVRRALLALTVLATLLVAGSHPAAAAAAPPATAPPASYLAVDGETGAIVAASNEHAPRLTASTIKILTALVALEHLSPDSPIHVSRLAAAQPAMKIGMQEGSTWTLDETVTSLLVVSANDAAYALAENAGGDLDHFATLATETGHRLGLRDTTFKDPAGLDGAEGHGGGTTSSAYDLAIIARNALAIPAIVDTAAKVTADFTDPSGVGRHLVNHNKGFLTGYPGAIGLKTGFTKAANRTLLAAARRDGHTCIASVMGTWDDTGWAGYLLDQCFAGVRAAGAAPLPPVRAQTVQDRVEVYAGLPRALGSSAGTAVAAATRTRAKAQAAAKAASPKVPRTDAATTRRSADAGPPASATATRADAAAVTTGDSGSSLGSVLRTAGLALLAVLVILVLLRRRAVKRRRARRAARTKALAEARRRKMIDVVEVDETSDVRVVPARTGHHVAAAGRRRTSDRRVVRATRPRDATNPNDRRRR